MNTGNTLFSNKTINIETGDVCRNITRVFRQRVVTTNDQSINVRTYIKYALQVQTCINVFIIFVVCYLLYYIDELSSCNKRFFSSYHYQTVFEISLNEKNNPNGVMYRIRTPSDMHKYPHVHAEYLDGEYDKRNLFCSIFFKVFFFFYIQHL